MRKNVRFSALIAGALVLAFCFTSCARLGVRQKVALVCITGGSAGVVVAQQSRLSAAANLVGGIVPLTSAAAIITAEQATADQMQRAEQVGRKYVERITPAKRAYYKKKNIKYVSVKTSSTNKTRGTSVMVYDIEKKKVASPKVYDVRVEPEPGASLEFDTFVTEYVGE